MDLKVQLKTLDLIVKIINGSMDRINLVEYAPQKVVFDRESPYEQAFLRATPESVGISSRYLSRFLKDVSKDPLINMHGIMILKDGRVISCLLYTSYSDPGRPVSGKFIRNYGAGTCGN